MLYGNILETIGNTPLIRLNRIPPPGVEIYAKVEFFNPGGSVKDRIASQMISDAEEDGLIREGDTIIEPTSGNTGIGLAMVAAAKGYRIILTMPETMSLERRKILKAFGAELVLTPGAKGMAGAVQEAERLASEKGYFMPQQFNNPSNPKAHRLTTGPEIVKSLNGRRLDYFVAGVGTGGTVTGAGSYLKKHYPGLRVIAVEPSDSPVLSGGKPGPHKIQGIGAGFVPRIYDPAVADAIVQVMSGDAMSAARRAVKEEGLFIGISSGAALHAALGAAKEAPPGAVIVVVFPDTGERYLSTELFE